MSWRRFAPLETKAQLRLYYLLGQAGIRYISQQHITVPDVSNDGLTQATFLIDVLIPQPQTLPLLVEVDGESHDNSRQMEKDIWKNACLKKAGYDVLRFKDADIDKEPEWVLNMIRVRLN